MGDSGNGGSGSSGGSVIIATTSTSVSVATAAGSADPLVLGCRLSWPNSASDGMVNRPIPQSVAVVTSVSASSRVIPCSAKN